MKAKKTTLAFRIDKVGLKDAQDLIDVAIKIHVVDKMGTLLERVQVTPTPTGELCAMEPLHIHFGCIVFINTAMEDEEWGESHQWLGSGVAALLL